MMATGIDPLADADLLLSLPDGHPGIGQDVSFDFNAINFYDAAGGGDRGLFLQDEAFPYDIYLEDDDHFALKVTATLVIPEESAGEFRFAVHSDDGSRLRIDGANVILDNALHPPQLQSSDVDSPCRGRALRWSWSISKVRAEPKSSCCINRSRRELPTEIGSCWRFCRTCNRRKFHRVC